ncbi:MAG: hypothetical protein J6U37_06230 [Lachnospiraceae bacterium]|nr:hypothetical protein [Lachnospiraceae bacterium]
MLISNAVDSAALELSEYSYVYKMSGLQKLNDDITSNAKIGRDNINDVIGGIDELYSTISESSFVNSDEIKLNIESALEDNPADPIGDVVTVYNNLKTDATNILTSLENAESKVNSVAENPMLYVKSIAAATAGEAFDLMKSRLVAAPLSKALVKKHFTVDGKDADTYLRELGVVDGLSGLNFNMSTVFSGSNTEDIHIVCYYRLFVVQILIQHKQVIV